MKDTPFESRPYRVTVSGIVTTTVSVFAESEDDAIRLVQEVCDRTRLIPFLPQYPEEITADEAVEILLPNCSGVREHPEGHECD